MHMLKFGYLAVRTAFGTTKHYAGPQRQRLGRRVAAHPSLERLAFVLAQFDADGGSSSCWHSAPLMLAHIRENAPVDEEIPTFPIFLSLSSGQHTRHTRPEERKAP